MSKIIQITYRLNDIIDTVDVEDEDIRTKDNFYQFVHERFQEEAQLRPAAIDVCDCEDCQAIYNKLKG